MRPLRRRKQVQAADAAEGQASVGEFGHRAAVEFHVLQAIGEAIRAGLPAGGIEAHDADVRAQPQRLARALGDAEHHRRRRHLGGIHERVGEADVAIAAFDHPAQAGMAADPDRAIAALVERPHQIPRQTVGPVAGMAEVPHAPARRIEQVQAIAGAEPEPAAAVLDHGIHPWIVERMTHHATAMATVVQRAVGSGAQPQVAVAVDGQAEQGQVAVRPEVDGLDLAGFGVQPHQAIGGRQPQPAMPRAGDRGDPGDALAAGGARQQPGFVVEAVERDVVAEQARVVGGDPQCAIVALPDRADAVVGRRRAGTGRCLGGIEHVGEAGAARVGDGDAAELPPDPQHAATVDQQRIDGVVGQAGLDLRVLLDPVAAARQRVVTAQPAAVERQPQPAIRGLDNRVHGRRVAGIGIVAGPDPVQAAVRQHPVQPIATAHPYLPLRAERQAAGGRGGAHEGGLQLPVDPVQAGVAGVPDIAGAIAEQALPRRILQLAWVQHEDRPAVAGGRVQHLHPGRRGDPQLARARQQGHHRALAVGSEALDAAGHQVEPGHVLRIRADPQRASALDRERADVAFGEAGGILRVVPVGHETAAVVTVQAALRADPDEPLRVLRQRGDGVLAQRAVAAGRGEVELARRRRGARRQAQPEPHRHGRETCDETSMERTTTHGQSRHRGQGSAQCKAGIAGDGRDRSSCYTAAHPTTTRPRAQTVPETDPTPLPELTAVEAEIQRLSLATTAPELHGALCGWLSGGGASTPAWLAPVLVDDTLTAPAADSALDRLRTVSAAQLADRSFSFELLLPASDATIEARSGALFDWCRGFLGAFGLAAGGQPPLSEEGTEALGDLAKLAGAQPQDDDGDEDDEQALAEIEEFVRVAVLLLHGDCVLAAQHRQQLN